MSTVNLSIIPPTLTNPYCFTSWQQVANDLVGGAVVQMDITGATIVLKQNTTPTSSQRAYLWFNTDTGRTLRYDSIIGSWVAEHSIPNNDLRCYFFPGTAGAIDTLDGGSAGTVSLTSGPFWQINTAMQARFPVGVGTFPLSGIVIGSGATGGLDQVTLAMTNLPDATVLVNTKIVGNASVTGFGGNPVVGSSYGSDPIPGSVSACDATNDSSGLTGCYYTKGQTDALGSGTAINTPPPWYGGYWITRTNRKYYTS